MSHIIRKQVMVIILLLLFIITQWSSTLFLPVIPEIVSLFSHKTLISASISLFFLGYAFGQLFWGMLSDYLGRYMTLLISLSLYIIFEFLLAAASNAVYFAIFIAMTGSAIAANTAVGNALIRDVYSASRAKTMIAFVGVVMSSGPVIAPLMSAAFYAIAGWKLNAYFLAALGVLILTGFALVFAATHKNSIKPESAAPAAMLKETLLDKKFMTYVAVLALSFGVFFAVLLAIPFVLTDSADFSVSQVAYWMFLVSAAGICGTILNMALANRKSQDFIINLGLVLALSLIHI